MAEIRRDRNDKMRQDAVDISMAVCDIIEAIKRYDDIINNCEEISTGQKKIMAESLREMIVQMLYGEDAYVVNPSFKKQPYEKFYMRKNLLDRDVNVRYASYKEKYNPDERIDPSEYEHPEED